MSQTLTPKQEAFAVAMADPTCAGPTEAMARAGYSTENRSPGAVNVEASRLASNPKIALRIAELRNAVAEPAMIEARDVLREWLTIATADPSELTRVRRWCCRHCYGIEHRYQWVNDDEFAAAVCRVIDYNATKSARAHSKSLPDYEGGTGYDRNRAPLASCPMCSGDGEYDVFVADTRSMSAAARKLFAGVKTTRDGIEVKMRDQDGALQNIAKYLGMLVERHRHGGDPDNPTPVVSAQITANMDPKDAAALYQLAVAALK